MVLDDETLTPNTLIFQMASLSPKVRDSLENESYRLSATQDQVDEQYVLEDAFKNLIEDLNEIGLVFNTDYSDYVSDLGKLDKFLQLCQLLLPNGLYQSLKSDSQLRNLIEQIVNGSIGDGDSSVIQTYLTELGGLDGTLAFRPLLTDFIDQVYPLINQTPQFSDYLSNLIHLYYDEVPAPPTDGERHSQYRDHIRTFIGVISDAVNFFETEASYQTLLNIQNFIIRDLIASDNFTAYAYLFIESVHTLPEELHNGYHNKWYHYEVSHPWCFAYYQVRGTADVIPIEYRQIIYAVALARSGLIKANWDKLIADMQQRYPIDTSTLKSLETFIVE